MKRGSRACQCAFESTNASTCVFIVSRKSFFEILISVSVLLKAPAPPDLAEPGPFSCSPNPPAQPEAFGLQRIPIRCISADGVRWIASCVNEYCPNTDCCVDSFVKWANIMVHSAQKGAGVAQHIHQFYRNMTFVIFSVCTR